MSEEPVYGAKIPADVETPDKILAGLTARQIAILALAGLVVWVGYSATQDLVPLAVFAAVAVPFGAAAAGLALGRRDGLPLDRLVLAALRQSRSPRRLVLAPEGVTAQPGWADAEPDAALPAPLRLPAQSISADGVIDLGGDGTAVLCAASTASFALRTPAEQAAMVGVFGRWLNALSGPAQIVVRAEDIDLGPLVVGLRAHASQLPCPELEQAAIEHADFLADLAGHRDLLRRQVLIVLREPRRHAGNQPLTRNKSPRSDSGAAQRVLRRAEETARALAEAGITVRVLDGGQAAAALAACCNPWHPRPGSARPEGWADRAAPDQAITTNGELE